MVRVLRLIAVLLLLPLVASAQSAITDDASVPFNKDVITGKTKNGIPYYLLKNGKPEKRLDLILTINAGAVLEDADQNGLAHFCEHMAFNGTKDFPKQALVNFLESTGMRFGADANAYTNQDETVYMLTVPTDKLQDVINAVKVLRDWAAYVTYADVDIDEERGVVTEEWRLGRSAAERLSKQHSQTIFNGSKYAEHDVIGDTVVLKGAPPDRLRAFYHKWYAPENMALIAVGDFDMGSLHDVLIKYFAFTNEAQSMAQMRPAVMIPDNKNLMVSVASDPEQQVASLQYFIRRRADTIRTYKEYRRQIVQQMAYSMINSRLAELTQKADPPFIRAGAGQYGLAREHRAMYATAVAAGKNIMVSANALFTELERAQRHGFTDTELQRAKDQTMATMEQYFNERDKTENQQFAFELVRHVLEREAVPGITHELEIFRHYVPQITAEDCKQVLASTMTDHNRVITISVPEGNDYVKPTEKQVRDLLAAVAAKDIEPYVDNVPLKPLMANAPKAGGIKSSKDDAEVEAKILTLSNGATVILKKTDFKNDQILFSADAVGGQSIGQVADHVTLSSAAALVDQSGLGEFDNPTLMKMLQGKTVKLSPYIGMEEHGLRGEATPKDLQTFFELVHLYFTQPRVDSDAVSAWKTRLRAQLENQGKSPEGTFFDSVTVILSDHHPRAVPMTVQSLEQVDPAKALAFYKKLFSNAASFTLTIVGNFDVAEMEGMVKTYLASLPSSGQKTNWSDVGIRRAKGKVDHTVLKGEEPKSFVMLNFNGPVKYTPENRFDVLALTEVMEIRLREKLREQASGVYFVSVQPQVEHIPIDQYDISIIFSCNPDRVNELVDITLKEIDTLKMKPVGDIYTDKVREIQFKEREVQLKENGFWLRAIPQLMRDNEPFTVIKQRKQLIAGIKPAKVQEAAKVYLSTDNFARLVLKPVLH
jgi:zinc protease